MWNFALNKLNYKLYAIAHYKNGKGTWCEFFNDFKMFQTLQKMFFADTKSDKDIKNILNLIIKISNSFYNDSLARLLFVQFDESYHSDIKTYLQFLNKLPESIPDIDLGSVDINFRLLMQLERIG